MTKRSDDVTKRSDELTERTHLDRAREQLRLASDVADRPTQTQLDSLEEGLLEELEGERTQVEPDPKIDHVVEIEEKLDELQMDVSEPEVKERIERAREHCLSYLRETTS